MKKKTLCYYALYDYNTLKGVHNKIISTIEGFNAKGYKSSIFGFENSGNPSFYKMILSIIFNKYDIIIVRSVSYYNIFLIPSLLIARIRGTYIILDIPTPFKSALYEILSLNKNIVISLIKIISTLFGAIIISCFSNLLLTYGNDSEAYNVLFRRKILMVSNFSSNNIYECRSNCPKSVSNKLNLVGVGNFSDSHGYDLVMESIHIWNNDINKPFKVYLTLVGSGEYEKFLKLKSKQLEIESFVNFMGYLNYNEYKEIYCLSHIAVGSIASFRKNLKFHSPLKEREYTFVGIPFISSINDIGFINDCEFRYVIEADSPIQGLLNLYNNIDKFISIPPALISNYASAYFTFDNFYSQIKKKAQSDIFQ